MSPQAGLAFRRPIGRRVLRYTPPSRVSGDAMTLLGSILRAEWDSTDATTIVAGTSWTDRKNGYVLTAMGSPTFGADGANFNGRSVWQFVKASSQGMRTGLATGLIPAGSGFYMSWVSRDTQAVFGTLDLEWQLNPAAGGGTYSASHDRFDATTYRIFSGAATISTSTFDTSVHLWELTGSTGPVRLNLFRDGVLLGSGAPTNMTVPLAVAIERCSLCVLDSGVSFADRNYARVRLCSAVPNAAIRKQLQAIDRATWGTP